MCFRTWIYSAAYFWNPEPDAVVSEDGKGQPELAAVERTLRLANDDCIKTAVLVREGVQQSGGLWTALPWQRA